ncbi:MAG: hypothetical protein ACKO5F_13535 [Synechococcus sp.]
MWFAPYSTFPEAGYVESTARRGVYDTLLAIPSDSGIAVNYGATKLTPADTLFSLASAHGLAAEYRLAQRLGYGFYALDLGAVSDPAGASALCRRTRGCVLSSDAYALFPIIATTSPALQQGLASLQRRMPLLPQQSAGPSWGPLVFSPFQWGPVQFTPSSGGTPFVVKALPRAILEIYRYPLSRFPAVVRPQLRLNHRDVQLELAPDVQTAELCIGPAGSSGCRLLRLGPGHRHLPIGNLLPPGRLTRLTIQQLQRTHPGLSPLAVSIREPQGPQPW